MALTTIRSTCRITPLMSVMSQKMSLPLSVHGGFISDFAANAEAFAGGAEAFIGFVEFSVVVRGSVASAGGPGEVAANGGDAVRVLPRGTSSRVVANTGADGVMA